MTLFNSCKLNICGSCDYAQCTSVGIMCTILSSNYDILTDTCEDYKSMTYEDDEES